MPEETLDYALHLNLSNAAQVLKSYREEVQQLKKAFVETIQAQTAAGSSARSAFNQALEELKKYSNMTEEARSKTKLWGADIKTTSVAAKGAISEITSEMKNYAEEAEDAGDATSGFGSISNFVFGTVLGITAVGAIRKVIDALKEAVQAGLEWSQTVFTLEVAVRALQRVGVVTTIKDFRIEAERIKSLFPLFTIQEIEDALSQTALYTRELGFTEDQIFKVNEASIILAQLMGRDVAEASRMVAVALSSGYTEGLQRMGLAITKAQIEQRALEMGFEGSIQTMTTAEKAAATYSIIMEQVALLSEDASKAQNTFAGNVQQSKTRFREISNTIGAYVSPAFAFLLDVLSKAAEAFFKLFQLLLYAEAEFRRFASKALAPVIAIAQTLWDTLSGERFSIDKVKENLREIVSGIDMVVDAWEEFVFSPEVALSTLEDLEGGLGEFSDAAEEAADDFTDAWEKIQKAIDDVNFKRMQSVIDENRDLQDDLEDIDRKGADKREDIWRNYYDKLEDIVSRENDKIADAYRDLEYDLEKLDRDIAKRQEDARQKAREKELEEERKLQDELRKLRDKYFFDLEELIRKRDVGGALRLSRKYQFDKTEIARDFDERRKANKEELEAELKDIEAYRKRKLQELQIEHERRIEEIRLQAEREREEAAIWREREFRDLEEWLTRQREARWEKHRQELRDIDIQARQRIQKIINGLKAEYEVTYEFAQNLLNLIQQIYGSGGIYDQFVSGFQLPGLDISSPGPGIIRPNPGQPGPSIFGFGGYYADGGSFIADRPTAIIVGEGMSPERVDITPLSGLMGQGRSIASPEISGQVEVGISLSEGLVGHIIRQSQEGVVVSLEKIRRTR